MSGPDAINDLDVAQALIGELRRVRFIYARLFATDISTLDLMNAWAPAFFAEVRMQFGNAIVLGISKLLESENFGLYTIVARIRRIDPEASLQLKNSLDALRKQTEKLKLHRDKAVAHTATEFARGQIELPSMPFADASAIIDQIELLHAKMRLALGFTPLNWVTPNNVEILVPLENALIWRELRSRADRMTSDEIVQSVRRGHLDCRD